MKTKLLLSLILFSLHFYSQTVNQGDSPRGLTNEGNSCFLNATTNALVLVPTVATTFLENQKTIEKSDDSFVKKFMDLAKKMTSLNKSGTVKMANFAPSITQEMGLTPGRQEDAEEFATKLIDRVDGFEVKTDNNQVEKPFASLFKSKILETNKCNNCGLNSSNETSANILNVEIKGKNSSLYDSLNSFFGKETIKDARCTDGCNKLGRDKTIALQQLAPVLALSLKRFNFDRATQIRTKNNDAVKIPFALSLDAYKSSYYKSPKLFEGKYLYKPSPTSTPQALLRKVSPVLLYDGNQSQKDYKIQIQDNDQYHLKSIVTHSGSAKEGHYTAYVNTENGWHYLNDKTVTPVNNIREFEKHGYLSNNKKFTPYLLFYEKKNNNFAQLKSQEKPPVESYHLD